VTCKSGNEKKGTHRMSVVISEIRAIATTALDKPTVQHKVMSQSKDTQIAI
jgi:hypothetical protein